MATLQHTASLPSPQTSDSEQQWLFCGLFGVGKFMHVCPESQHSLLGPQRLVAPLPGQHLNISVSPSRPQSGADGLSQQNVPHADRSSQQNCCAGVELTGLTHLLPSPQQVVFPLHACEGLQQVPLGGRALIGPTQMGVASPQQVSGQADSVGQHSVPPHASSALQHTPSQIVFVQTVQDCDVAFGAS